MMRRSDGSSLKIALLGSSAILGALLVARTSLDGVQPDAPDLFVRSSAALNLLAASALLSHLGVVAFFHFIYVRPTSRLSEAVLDEDPSRKLNGLVPELRAKGLRTLATRTARALYELTVATEQVRTDHQFLEAVLDGMDEGVLVFDSEDRIVLGNRAIIALSTFGGELRGRSAIEILRTAELHELVRKVRKTKESSTRELELGRPLPRRFLVRITQLTGAAVPDGLLAVFHDVTELRRLETIRTDFVTNVSHELRTPVAAISASAETLLSSALANPADAREFVDVISRHAERLKQLVDDLLDLSKIESKAYSLTARAVDVSSVVRHVAELAAPSVQQVNGSLTLDLDDEAPHALSDAKALEQILINLVDNALKYGGPKPKVRIVLRAGAELAQISVSDQGQGIAPQHIARIFERFYRVDTGRSRELGGTGLGLAIVKHLTELMHGAVHVESQLGSGTTFHVLLPNANVAGMTQSSDSSSDP